MELTFTKVNETYIADYVATTHFNLHIEGGGRILLYKRTSGSQGDLLASIPSKCVVDIDVAVNHEATYTIVLGRRTEVVLLTTADGVISGVMPEEAPSGYEYIFVSDGMAFTGSDENFYVKL